jgi:hypothetical protein
MITTIFLIYLCLTAGYAAAHLDTLRRDPVLVAWIALRWPLHVISDIRRK